MASKTVAGQPGLDPTLPNIKLTVDGVDYPLMFDFNSIVRIQAETGINLMLADVELIGNPVVGRLILWAALLPAHPEMTQEAAGKLVTLKSFRKVTELLVKAWKESMPEPEPGNDAGE